jgi:hypothetical protein
LFIHVNLTKIYCIRTLFKVWFIQDSGLDRFIQDFGLFSVWFRQDFDLFEVWFRRVYTGFVLFEVWFRQDFGLFSVWFIQDFDLFRCLV